MTERAGVMKQEAGPPNHRVVPPSPVGPLARSRLGRWLRSPEFADAILPTLGIRLAILLFAPLAVLLLGDSRALAHLPTDIWNMWDARRYLEVAQVGYGGISRPDQSTIAPLLPGLLRLGSLVLPSLTAGLLISLTASLAAALGLYRLALRDGANRAIARAAVLALSIFPTAFLLVPPYTEPLFLALVIWAFWRARQADWIGAGLLGLAAGLTRFIPGLFILPALLFELRGQRRSWRMLGLLLIVLGPLAYLGINWWAYNDPFFFLSIQEKLFYTHLAAPWTVIGGLIASVAKPVATVNWATLYLAPLLALALLGLTAAWTWLSARSRASYLVYTGLCLLNFATLSWPISVPRYIVCVFPLFLMCGGLARSRLGSALAVFSILLLALFTAEFAMGRWAF